MGHHAEYKQRSWRLSGCRAVEASSQGIRSPRRLVERRWVGESPGYVTDGFLVINL
ncbi:MAG: hypothetical protein SFW36_01400 [Leptolyngbyaceae cyanobacterium bins.59]|nr:hypothetical protein [Leptolyngbyaceae cyanobacterium bins.59]